LIDRLPPRDRLVLVLIYVEGHTVDQAAQLAGWSKTMVKVQVFRARRKLRALAAELGIDTARAAREASEDVLRERV
jgi:RNA polymerase sigma-70 factor, ECF subfamily